MSIETNIERLDTAHQLRVMALAVVRCGWLFFACGLFLFVADRVFVLNTYTRLLLDGALIVFLIGTIGGTIYRQRKSQSKARMLVRMLENEDASMRNTLVNAIDFEERFGTQIQKGVSRSLMEEEVPGVGGGVWGQEIMIAPTDLVRASGAAVVNLSDKSRPAPD